jgi:2-C-methyl-D-erythritol 4-phosphate cytidylyltransferase
MSVSVVVPAGGSGRRIGGVPKAFLPIAGEPMLLHALRPFLAHRRVTSIVIALRAEDASTPPGWLTRLDSRVRLVTGGVERADSVRAGLAVVPDDANVILIHDAARPLVTAHVIDLAIEAADSGNCAVIGVPVTDTLQQVDEANRIVSTPERRWLWHAQTPQAFPRDTIVQAYRRAAREAVSATDDSTLVLRYGGSVVMIQGDPGNLKITTQADIVIAEALLRARSS